MTERVVTERVVARAVDARRPVARLSAISGGRGLSVADVAAAFSSSGELRGVQSGLLSGGALEQSSKQRFGRQVMHPQRTTVSGETIKEFTGEDTGCGAAALSAGCAV